MMFDLGYVRPEEVPEIPRLAKSPKAILFSPLAIPTAIPDVILFACKPAGAMLCRKPRMERELERVRPLLGRPTCMALPASLQHETITSLGCIGNRVYTGLEDDEMYVVVRGKDIVAVAEALNMIESANAALSNYAKGRRQELAST